MNTTGGATLVVQNRTTINSTSPTKVAPPAKKNLPHIDTLDYYQFVTFRTYDSLDDYLLKVGNENISTKLKQYKIDEYLDSSLKGSYLNAAVLKYLKSFLISKDGDLYDLIAFCVMPNHIHILFKQKREMDKIMQILKGSSSIEINKMLNKKGRFWEKSYYDKAIRDEKHFFGVYEYIAHNAVKANLQDAKERFYGIY